MSKRNDPHRESAGPHPDLTEAEWAIMRIVWEHQPCAAGTVQEALQESRDWAYSTVKTTMDRMVAKGLLECRRIRNLNLFTARISEPQAKQSELRKMLRRAFNGALSPMLQFLIENEELSESDLKNLREMAKNTPNRRR